MKESEKMRKATETVNTVKNVIANRSRALAEKAKEITEISKLKAQIMSCEEIIRKNYLEIGKMVYGVYEDQNNKEENYADSVEQSTVENQELTQEKALAWEKRYKKQCTAIENAQKAIEELERRIAELKQ